MKEPDGQLLLSNGGGELNKSTGKAKMPKTQGEGRARERTRGEKHRETERHRQTEKMRGGVKLPDF